MARPRSDHPLKMYSLRLYEGDPERLQDFYPRKGYATIIRSLIRHHIRKIEERAERRTKDIDIEVI